MVEQRILDQAARLGPGQAITGWAALRLWGAGLFDGVRADGHSPLPVPLAVGTAGRHRPERGATICHDRLPPRDRVLTEGTPLTTVQRATFDAVRLSNGVRDAVAVIDTVLGAGLLSLPDLETWTAHRSGWKGVRRMRAALPLARQGVRSPKETVLRLRAELDAGSRALLVNHVVHRWLIAADGSACSVRIGEVDLLDPYQGMVLEFDGADHRTAAQHTRDIAKQQALEDVGLVVARFTAADLASPALVTRRIAAARSRAAHRPADPNQWHATPPDPRLNQTLLRRLGSAQ